MKKFYEIVLDSVRNLKRFCEEGSFRVFMEGTLLGFLKLFYDFFRDFNSFGSYLMALSYHASVTDTRVFVKYANTH